MADSTSGFPALTSGAAAPRTTLAAPSAVPTASTPRTTAGEQIAPVTAQPPPGAIRARGAPPSPAVTAAQHARRASADALPAEDDLARAMAGVKVRGPQPHKPTGTATWPAPRQPSRQPARPLSWPP
jgi:hypothetical protein